MCCPLLVLLVLLDQNTINVWRDIYILYEAHRTAVVAAAADAAVKCPLRTSDIAFYVVSLII
jgi:hypothetical protein